MSNSDTPITCADIPVGKTVTVKVPASSANLGPGYDTLGVALGFYDELRVECISEGLEFELSGEGSEAVPRDETHLVIQAMHAASRGAGFMRIRSGRWNRSTVRRLNRLRQPSMLWLWQIFLT